MLFALLIRGSVPLGLVITSRGTSLLYNLVEEPISPTVLVHRWFLPFLLAPSSWQTSSSDVYGACLYPIAQTRCIVDPLNHADPCRLPWCSRQPCPFRISCMPPPTSPVPSNDRPARTAASYLGTPSVVPSWPFPPHLTTPVSLVSRASEPDSPTSPNRMSATARMTDSPGYHRSRIEAHQRPPCITRARGRAVLQEISPVGWGRSGPEVRFIFCSIKLLAYGSLCKHRYTRRGYKNPAHRCMRCSCWGLRDFVIDPRREATSTSLVATLPLTIHEKDLANLAESQARSRRAPLFSRGMRTVILDPVWLLTSDRSFSSSGQTVERDVRSVGFEEKRMFDGCVRCCLIWIGG